MAIATIKQNCSLRANERCQRIVAFAIVVPAWSANSTENPSREEQVMVQPLDSMMKVPLEPWEIGGELLDILSRGLYSDARDVIREYAQNGIDANASHILVTVAGPQVVIRDDGVGMDWETIRKARRFGLSEKNSRDNVGFRGIGLYSAFGMCEILSITSHPAESAKEYTVQFGVWAHASYFGAG